MKPAFGAGLLLAMAPLMARAEQWTLENTLATRYEVNDNAALAATSSGTMNILSVSSSLAASRRSENASTGLRAAMSVVQEQGPRENDRIDGQWGATQTYTDPLNSLNLSALYLQDINSGLVENSDVLVGRSRRKSSQFSAGLSRQLTERWSANTQAAVDRTGYGAADTSDYRNLTLGGVFGYRLSDLQTWTFDASQSRYRTDDGTASSTTDQASLGWSSALSERQSVSLSLGGYRTRSKGLRYDWVCQGAPQFCVDHGVGFVRISRPVQDTQRGLQFNLSHRLRLDESTDFALSAARQQSPSGAGVVARRDTLSATATHGFSPVSSGSVGYSRNRATYHAFSGDVQRSEQSVSLAFNHRLADDLSLQAAARHLRADGGGPGGRARANSVSLSLSYDWPRLDASR